MSEVNKTNADLGHAFAKTGSLLRLLCRLTARFEKDEPKLRWLRSELCGQHNLTRALVGRLLVYANVSDPCCYPGPLDKPTKCGGMFRCDSARGQSTIRASR